MQAMAMKKYMRNQFEFYGIKVPELRTLIKQFHADFGLPPIAQMHAIAKAAYNYEEREMHQSAILTLFAFKKNILPETLEVCEWLIVNRSWWDTVDHLHKINALVYDLFPECRKKITSWSKADNLWLRRSAIIFQISRKHNTEQELLFDICRQNSDSKEFFIQKAIGWALREYAYVNPGGVKDFVLQNDLKPLSKREALKHFK